MTAKRTYYLDGEEIDEALAFDENGIIRDGVTMRTPVLLRDSAGNTLVDGRLRLSKIVPEVTLN